MRILGCQFSPVWEDRLANFSRVTELVRPAFPAEGGLIVLPEMFSTGFSMNVEKIREQEPDSATEAFLADLAAQSGAAVLGGLVTQTPERMGRNELVVYGPERDRLARYQKIRTFTYTKESDHYVPGKELVLFGWQGWKVCPLICYDLRFPELFRRGVAQGAELFVVIASWPAARVDHWVTLLRARAIENQAYVVGVNRCGSDPNLAYPGRSIVVDPHGKIVADAEDGEGLLEAELERRVLLDWRAEFPALADRVEI